MHALLSQTLLKLSWLEVEVFHKLLMLLLLFKHFHNKLARKTFFLAGVLRWESSVGKSMQLFVWVENTE